MLKCPFEKEDGRNLESDMESSMLTGRGRQEPGLALDEGLHVYILQTAPEPMTLEP
jgi:hypothetical protein